MDKPIAATEVTIKGCTGSNHGCFIGDPAISPDGRRIASRMAALTSQGTNDGPYDIHVVDVLSNRMWQVTDTSEDSGNPAYSSDGRWLAFDQCRDIYKADLTHGQNNDPVWMKPGDTGSRGALIAFSTSRGSG